jgi:hypothetical protein
MKRLALVLLLLPAGLVQAQEKTLVTITINAGKHNYENTPVCVPLTFPEKVGNTLEGVQGFLQSGMQRTVYKLTKPGLTTPGGSAADKEAVRLDLHFILDRLKAGESKQFQVMVPSKGNVAAAGGNLIWGDGKAKTENTTLNLQRGDGLSKPDFRPVLRYMNGPYDNSSPEKRNKTYKVFHHLYEPGGTKQVTNGGHSDLEKETPEGLKNLLFPHHRGLSYAFNRITYDGNRKADTWHCTNGAHTAHVKTLEEVGGHGFARHRVLIDWYGSETDVFAREEREITVYNVPGGTLVEFASLLKTTGGAVKLDGDPQHAGFQFRAANDVAKKTAKQTYYLRVDGKGAPGATINWAPKNAPKGTVDVPWKAMSFVLDDKRYTVAYLDHPDNPGEARHSERDYGRFGYYFEYEVTKENPLRVNYRIWLQNGEMTGDEVQDMHQDFVSPPTATIKY